MAITEIVYFVGDNCAELEVSRDGVLLPLDGVTRMVLTLENGSGDAVIDSDAQPAALSWQSPGKLKFKLGGVGLAPGTYAARLIVYDPTHPNGQVLIDGFKPHALMFDLRAMP